MNHSISCTYIGHATTFIKIGETEFCTDPHFGKRTLTQKRHGELPIDPAELPDFSAILLSHMHFDHLHVGSYKFISCKTPIIVPEGCERAVGRFTPNPIIELSHYAKHTLADGTEITAVPMKHHSFRVLPFRFTSCNGYLIQKPEVEGAVFYCGDSAYCEHFGEIGNLGKIKLAILPIGAYEPRWFMKSRHMNPEEAVQAFEDLKAEHMIPTHYGTFRLSCESPGAPAKRLGTILDQRSKLKSKVHILKPGEQFSA
ncbi:MAG: MBL fold metallo-hydrolase [Deltaproteobacteria bacterium]|jgi:L-ascorbate metabolism protein UlaG (beta-lactamase superfamily)|nr:MBL fold metallo-hydrolase [Deltaproteobacteria bacterium]